MASMRAPAKPRAANSWRAAWTMRLRVRAASRIAPMAYNSCSIRIGRARVRGAGGVKRAVGGRRGGAAGAQHADALPPAAAEMRLVLRQHVDVEARHVGV